MASELILQQSEVLVFLDALGVRRVPGIQTGRLVPHDANTRRQLLLSGITSLIEKGVMDLQDGIHILPRFLIDIFELIISPDVMVILRKDTPGQGGQTFLQYFAGDRCIELTFPSNTEYRFLEIPSAADVINRLYEIFPLRSEVIPIDLVQMSMSDFNRFMDLAEGTRTPGIAELIDQAVFTAELARIGLLEAFHQARFSGKLTILQMKGAEAVDAHDFMCLQGPQTAWLFRLDSADTSQIIIQPVTPQTCGEHFAQALGSLLRKL
jgi:hypothetical protein